MNNDMDGKLRAELLCLSGERIPRMPRGLDQDDVLPLLPRAARPETLPELLPQRDEGLPGQPGRPGHRVEPLHR